MYHILFIHSSINGTFDLHPPFGCIVSNTTVNMGMKIPGSREYLLSILWGIYSELLDHRIILFLIFEKLPYYFSFFFCFYHGCTILHSGQQCARVQILYIIANICLFCSCFYNSQLSGSEVLSHFGFDLHSPNN